MKEEKYDLEARLLSYSTETDELIRIFFKSIQTAQKNVAGGVSP